MIHEAKKKESQIVDKINDHYINNLHDFELIDGDDDEL